MNAELAHKLLKYLGQGIVIYLLFKYVPKDPMSSRDVLLITTIVILSYAVFENLFSVYYKDDKQLISSTQCNTQCAIKEYVDPKPSTQAEQSTGKPVEHLSGSVLPVVPIITPSTVLPVVPIITPSTVLPVVPTITPSTVLPEEANNVPAQLQLSQLGQLQIDSAQKKRDVEMEQYNVSKMANTGVYANPEITQQGVVRNHDGSYTFSSVRNLQSDCAKSRVTDGVMGSEMPYNYTDYNTLPVATTWDTWEQGSSFLPPAQWFPVPPHPPVCVQEKVCPVCPIFTNGTNVELKEWNSSRRVMPPDDINIKYVQEKLNSGR